MTDNVLLHCNEIKIKKTDLAIENPPVQKKTQPYLGEDIAPHK